MRGAVIEASVVEHHRRPWPEVDRGEREDPETGRQSGECPARGEAALLPGEPRDLETEPADHPVHLGNNGDASEPGCFASTEEGDQRTHDESGMCPEPVERERRQRRVDGVVGEEPQWDGGSDRTLRNDTESTHHSADRECHGPERSEGCGGRDHSAQAGGCPVGRPYALAFR